VCGVRRPQLKGTSLGGGSGAPPVTMTDLTKPAHVLIADYFAARGGGIDPGFGPDRLRLDLMSGERLTARNPFFDSDQLILFITLPDGTVRELRPSDIKAMWDARPNWPARIV